MELVIKTIKTRNLLMVHKFSIGKFPPGKPDYLLSSSTFPGNFPVGRTENVFHLAPNRNFRNFWPNGKRPWNQLCVGFFSVREENRRTRKKNPREAENRTNRNSTRATLVGGECSHQCAIPASPQWQRKAPNQRLPRKCDTIMKFSPVFHVSLLTETLPRAVHRWLQKRLITRGSDSNLGYSTWESVSYKKC